MKWKLPYRVSHPSPNKRYYIYRTKPCLSSVYAMTWGTPGWRLHLRLAAPHFSKVWVTRRRFGWWKFHVTIAVSYMRRRAELRAWPRQIPLLYVNVSKPKAPKSIRVVVVAACRWQFSSLLFLTFWLFPSPLSQPAQQHLASASDWLSSWPQCYGPA